MLDQIILTDPPLGTELRREPCWRYYRTGEDAPERNIVASRWADDRRSWRREQAIAPEDRYVLSIALRSTKLRFTRGALTLTEGRMPAGMIHVTGPAQKLEAEFHEPCDFVHLYVAEKYVAQCAAQLPEPAADLADLLVRDPVAGHLGRTLVETHAAGGWAYEETVGQTIITRLLMTRRSAPNVNPLPHPNATKVYASWFYSREGQQAMVDILAIPSNRADVDLSKLPPYTIPQPGVDYINLNDETYTGTERVQAMRDDVNKWYKAPQ